MLAMSETGTSLTSWCEKIVRVKVLDAPRFVVRPFSWCFPTPALWSVEIPAVAITPHMDPVPQSYGLSWYA